MNEHEALAPVEHGGGPRAVSRRLPLRHKRRDHVRKAGASRTVSMPSESPRRRGADVIRLAELRRANPGFHGKEPIVLETSGGEAGFGCTN
jgi:hypothetical protein